MTTIILHDLNKVHFYEYYIASEGTVDYNQQADQFLDLITTHLPYITLKLLTDRLEKRMGLESGELLKAVLAEAGIEDYTEAEL